MLKFRLLMHKPRLILLSSTNLIKTYMLKMRDFPDDQERNTFFFSIKIKMSYLQQTGHT